MRAWLTARSRCGAYAFWMTENKESASEAARHGPLFIVINVGSGHRDTEEEKQTMGRVFAESGRAHQFLQFDGSEPIEVLARRAVDLAKTRKGVVVAAGGDGTLSSVAGVVLGSGCPFGVLPQGTFNYFGRDNAISQDTDKACRALMNATISQVQVGLVNGRLFLVNASVGLYPQILEDREVWKQQLGRSRFVALLSGVATLLQSRHQLQLRIESDGQAASLRTPTLFVGNNRLQLVQAGINEAHAEAVAQGLLTGIAVRPIGTLALYGLLLRGLLGRLGEAENIQTFSFRRIMVAPKKMKRIKVALDGEVAWMRTPLVFEVAPEPLLLLVPASSELAEVE
ncbi:MAG: diacylglycerol kinase, catalytic region [Polaromonas sp.]|nr:diacylglycerol kinase, catalytic region [Polaromonas sp.]